MCTLFQETHASAAGVHYYADVLCVRSIYSDSGISQGLARRSQGEMG
jgi:hypothetical protein